MLSRELRLQCRRLAVETTDLIAEPDLLLFGLRLFQFDLFQQLCPLTRQCLQHRSVNVTALSVSLSDPNGEQRRTLIDDLALAYIERGDDASMRWEYFGDADRWHQEAGDGYLAGVVAGCEKHDRRANHGCQKPCQRPCCRGHRLPFNGSQRFPLERHCLGSEKAKLGHGCTPSMQAR
jgi:hypothetical protein